MSLDNEMGYSRNSFYRLKQLYEEGKTALQTSNRKKAIIKNRVPEHVKEALIGLAIENLALSPLRVSHKLQQCGIPISSSGVQSVRLHPGDETFGKRLKTVEAYSD